MYQHYFGFTENPFSIAPDPRFLYMSERHQEALAHLAFGATADSCIILLTGEVGTGKTTICRRFLEGLDRTTEVAIIINPKLTVNELLAAICDEFRIHVSGPPLSARQLLSRLNNHLLQVHAENRQALLVIDEAQHLDRDVLEMLRLLTNLETDRHKLLKIILLGQSELAVMLAQPDLTQISQRITSRYHLHGLQRGDLAGYIRHRIAIAGGGRSRLFTDAAVKAIFEMTNGIPRLINSLCDRALLGAYSEGKERVDRRIVKRAARELFGTRRFKRHVAGVKRIVPITALVIIALATGIWFGTKLTDRPVAEADRLNAEQQHRPAADADDADDPLLRHAGRSGPTRINIGPITVSKDHPSPHRTADDVIHP